MKFVSREAQNSTSLWPFWTMLSSLAAFSWRHSVQGILSMASYLPTSLLTTTLGHGCSYAALFWAKRAPNPENDSSEDNQVDNRLKKKTKKQNILLTLWRMPSQLQFFVFPPISSRTKWRHINTTWLPSSFKMTSSKVEFQASFETHFFRMAGLLEVETSVSGKT